MAFRGCTACGQMNPVANTYCQYCGAQLANLAAPTPPPIPATSPPLASAPPAAPHMAWQPPAPLWPPQTGGQSMWPAFEAARIQGLRDHTRTGLLLLAIGFGIGWIPLISFVGGILALIGVILLLLGRHGFGEAHHRNVVAGLLLLIVAFIATLAVTAIFVGSVLSTARSQGMTLSDIGSSLTGELQGLFLALVVIGIIASLAQVLLPYALADATDRWLLWAAFFLGAAISVLIGIFVLGQVDAAVASATSGATYNPGPIQDLQNQDTLLGAAKVVPDLLLAYAYYRIYVRVGSIPPPI